MSTYSTGEGNADISSATDEVGAFGSIKLTWAKKR
jgi:hypothetical protein